MNQRIAAVLLVLVTVFAGVPAPVAADHDGQCSFPMTVTDATGTEVTMSEDPERVVTTNPSAAQTMWEIGAKDEVVGVSQFAQYLDGASEKANVSGSGGLSVEAVIGLEPDVVLVPNTTYTVEKDRIAQLRDAGLTVVVFESGDSLEAVADKVERIGRITGNCEAGTERADEMRTSIENMERALEDVERPVGLNVFFGYAAGGETFISEIMTTGGLRNGAAEAGFTGFGEINEELVVEMNPEYLVVPSHAPIPSSPAYNSTTAIEEGNVVVVDANNLQQPAPRAIDASETILKAVHPDAYERYQELQNQSETTETTTTTSETTTATPETTAGEQDATATADDPQTTESSAPGFSAVAAVVALALTAFVGRRL
ncbi:MULTISPECIES: PGF-CTERM-anchored ABC transporter substrate-binding protein [Haloferax]|uniref:ABC transporter substrate-binding protein n=1 Tax=Haloferax marinum TaxID=2666143 RepID=A0A6A8G3F7_9EURY|nr:MULTISPECIES: PGF-CTERM-anchored ABC transporter substrate-binding protein [Haloferax]KAB1196664.1 ABC transporter substrate-binding protein [Haloferax sp. CBA1150]MRW95671.1 ABC transporter substrate-binding protein [Haloferax marinum]